MHDGLQGRRFRMSKYQLKFGARIRIVNQHDQPERVLTRCSMPGIGAVTVAAMLTLLPEIGTLGTATSSWSITYQNLEGSGRGVLTPLNL